MARPRLEAEDRRTRTIGVRVTAAEGAQLDERAEAARLTTATFVRQVVLGRPVRIASVRRLGGAEFAELNRIGVNLNQIARALNSGVPAPVGTREAVERVGELVTDLLTGEVG